MIGVLPRQIDGAIIQHAQLRSRAGAVAQSLEPDEVAQIRLETANEEVVRFVKRSGCPLRRGEVPKMLATETRGVERRKCPSRYRLAIPIPTEIGRLSEWFCSSPKAGR